jgi:hypothetical protein
MMDARQSPVVGAAILGLVVLLSLACLGDPGEDTGKVEDTGGVPPEDTAVEDWFVEQG